MEKTIHTEVCIVGAGAAGIAAAVGAVSAGRNVCILERNSYPGGRATASAVGTICGLYFRTANEEPRFAMKGFPREFGMKVLEAGKTKPARFAEGLWFIPSHPRDFESVARQYLEHERIIPMYDAAVTAVESSGSRITEITAAQGNDILRIVPECVVDCSGEGIVCRSINHPVITDVEYQAGAIVFELKDVRFDSEFNLGFTTMKTITKEIEGGVIPESFGLLSIVPGSSRGNSLLFKLGLPWKMSETEEQAGLYEKSHALVTDVQRFLKNIPAFSGSSISWVARETGVRTGLRATGKAILTDDDVHNAVKPADGIAVGAWPVEFWKTGSKRVEMTYFKEEDYYTVPPGCVESVQMENFFFAGKLLSAMEKAVASARVIGTCLSTGYAAGVLAAYKTTGRSRDEGIQFIRDQILPD